jgi:two-component system, cell cycle sensor histidine kinase and response regulator CckA
MRVLIADDIETNRKLLKAILEAEGMEVFVAADGQEALDLLDQITVDAIVSDILMPHVDGYRLCYEVRKDDRLKDIPIIIHSASYTSASDEKLAREFGADLFIKKSSSPSQVVKALMEVTAPGRQRTPRTKHSAADLEIMKEYSERLIEKLEERNTQLERTKRMLTESNRELLRRTEELGQSEEKFRGIIEHVEDVYFRANRRGVIEMVSPSADRYGYRSSDLMGSDIRMLCAQAEDARQLERKLADDGAASDFELVLNTKGGDTFVGSVNARALKDHRGRPAGIEGFVRDITERKHTEEVLRERSNLAALAADVGRAVIHNATVESMLSTCCDCFVNHLGAALARIWTLDNASGLLELQASSGGSRRPEYLYERLALGHLEIGRIASDRARILSNDVQGDTRISCRQWASIEDIVAFAGYPLIIADRLLGVVAVYSRKPMTELISEGLAPVANSIALGIERKLDEQNLRKAEEKYRNIFESSAEGILQTLPSGRVITANPAAARILGFSSPDDLMAGIHNMANHYANADDRQRLLGMIEAEGSKAMEVQFTRKGGAAIWVLARGRAVRDKDGAIAYYEVTIEDIAERKHLQEQLFQAQKMEAIGRLAGGVAHDFNNLLTAIIGYSSLAANKLASSDPIRQDVGEIEKAGRRAAALTNQLLVFSRKQVLQPKILAMNGVVRGLESMLKRLIGEDIALSTVLDPNTGPIRADPGQMEQIILNLAVNARDAMPEGGNLTIETEHIDLRANLPHPALNPVPYVLLSISDNGVGMDEQTLSRIFEPFFTTKEVGKGTGLGLSTVYGIMQQLGGHIDAKSKPGRGTTFKLYIPVVERPADDQQLAAPKPPRAMGTETILLVEDDDAVRALAKVSLEYSGYTVLDAGNADSAIKICQSHPGHIHLLLTDIVMPDVSGPKLAEMLLSIRKELKVL